MAVAPQDTQVNSGNNSTPSVAFPTGLVAGDLITVHLYFNDRFDATASLPTDFNLIQKGGVSTTSPYAACWYKVATGLESGTIDVTMGSGSNWKMRSIRWTGSDATPLLASSQNLDNNADTSVAAVTITPGVANQTIIFVVTSSGSAVASGYALTTDNPTFTPYLSDGFISLAYGQRASSAATGAGSATLNASQRNVVHLIAIDTAPIVGPVNVKTWDGTAQATAVKTYDGLALASVKTVNGLA